MEGSALDEERAEQAVELAELVTGEVRELLLVQLEERLVEGFGPPLPLGRDADLDEHSSDDEAAEAHVYEEGFGPRDKEDDQDSDPYSNYDFHNDPYRDHADELGDGADGHGDKSSMDSDSVDDDASSPEKEDHSADPDNDGDDADSPPSPRPSDPK